MDEDAEERIARQKHDRKTTLHCVPLAVADASRSQCSGVLAGILAAESLSKSFRSSQVVRVSSGSW